MFINFPRDTLHARFMVLTTDVCNQNFSFNVKIYIDSEFPTVAMLTAQIFLDVALCRLVLFLLLFLSSWTRDNWVAVTTTWSVLRLRREGICEYVE